MSFGFKFEPSRLTREEVQRTLTDPMGAADLWRFVGGEAGWILEVARLNYRQGQLVHADECLFDSSKSAPARATRPISPSLEGGAQSKRRYSDRRAQRRWARRAFVCHRRVTPR